MNLPKMNFSNWGKVKQNNPPNNQQQLSTPPANQTPMQNFHNNNNFNQNNSPNFNNYNQQQQFNQNNSPNFNRPFNQNNFNNNFQNVPGNFGNNRQFNQQQQFSPNNSPNFNSNQQQQFNQSNSPNFNSNQQQQQFNQSNSPNFNSNQQQQFNQSNSPNFNSNQQQQQFNQSNSPNFNSNQQPLIQNPPFNNNHLPRNSPPDFNDKKDSIDFESPNQEDHRTDRDIHDREIRDIRDRDIRDIRDRDIRNIRDRDIRDRDIRDIRDRKIRDIRDIRDRKIRDRRNNDYDRRFRHDHEYCDYPEYDDFPRGRYRDSERNYKGHTYDKPYNYNRQRRYADDPNYRDSRHAPLRRHASMSSTTSSSSSAAVSGSSSTANVKRVNSNPQRHAGQNSPPSLPSGRDTLSDDERKETVSGETREIVAPSNSSAFLKLTGMDPSKKEKKETVEVPEIQLKVKKQKNTFIVPTSSFGNIDGEFDGKPKPPISGMALVKKKKHAPFESLKQGVSPFPDVKERENLMKKSFIAMKNKELKGEKEKEKQTLARCKADLFAENENLKDWIQSSLSDAKCKAENINSNNDANAGEEDSFLAFVHRSGFDSEIFGRKDWQEKSDPLIQRAAKKEFNSDSKFNKQPLADFIVTDKNDPFCAQCDPFSMKLVPTDKERIEALMNKYKLPDLNEYITNQKKKISDEKKNALINLKEQRS